MPQQAKTDKTLFGTTVGLVFFGLVMVYSASSVMAMQDPRYHSSTYFVVRHAICLAPALLAMMFLKRTRYLKLQTPAIAFAAIGSVIILLFLVYLLDPVQHRWLRLAGVLNIQPAEVAKPAIVLFLAYFVAHRAPAINNRHTLWPAVMTLGLVIVAVAVPDLGTAVVLGITAAVVFFVAGLERRYCIFLLLIAMLAGGLFTVSKPYRLARIVHYFDPEYKLTDRFDHKGSVRAYLRDSPVHDTNYQAEQSKIAVGSGGLWGLGLMRGIQKYLYLPEAHTDFIYAVVGEELGLPGTLGVLAAFCVILWRGLRASIRAEDDFGKYLALGVTTMVVVQAFMNMTVVLAMVPTKGIPLPMISFGGNSLLTTLALMGMLMNVSENVGQA
jgi:cell division protein FtsW